MTLAWVIGGAAVLSAGTSLYEASQQQGISSEALGLAQTTQNEQMQYNNQLMNMLANPSSIFTNPAFTAATAVGEQGVAHQGAAAFGPNSTAEAAQLQQYGQGAGLSFLTSQEQLLASLSGAQAASSPTQALSTASGAASASAQSMGSLFYGLGALAGNYGGSGSSTNFNFNPLYSNSQFGIDPNASFGAGSNVEPTP